MKRLIILFGIILLSPGFLYGAIDPASNPGHTLLASFEAASTHWRAVIVPSAKWVFGALLTIDFVLEFGLLADGGKVDFSDLFPLLIRKTLMIGFFLMLFTHGDWLATIPASFSQLGDTASGVPVDPDNIIAAALQIVLSLVHGMSALHLADSIALFFSAIIILIAFGLMAAQLIMTIIKTYVFLALAPLVFSLAGLSQTRQMAYNPIFAIIKAGAELLLIKLFLGLSITMMHDFAVNVDNDDGSIFVMIIMSIVMASVVHMAGGIVEALFSGTVAQNSTAGLGTAAAVAAGAMGAAKSAAGGASAVKAASSLASSQGATGLSKIGAAVKNLGGAAMNDMRRSLSGGNHHGGTMGGRMANEMSQSNFAHSAVNATKASTSSSQDVGSVPASGKSDGEVASNAKNDLVKVGSTTITQTVNGVTTSDTTNKYL